MRILFMGTPDFAAVILNYLCKSENEVVCVVSQPDKKKGRGHKVVFTPVHEVAEANNISFYAPESLKDGAFAEILDKYEPEMIVVAAYGKILPKYILDYPKYGCVNVHASLLPKYRGASPIQQSIADGCEYTGVTSMYMAEGLDTGDMLVSKKIKIDEDETAEQLFDRLAELGGEVILETIRLAEAGTLIRIPQNDEESSYAPLITKESGKIDWTKSCVEIKNLVRAMNSWPLAYTLYKGEVVKIGSVEITGEKTSAKPGTILCADAKKGLIAAAGDGVLEIKTCRFEKKKMMNARDYLMGHSVEVGAELE